MSPIGITVTAEHSRGAGTRCNSAQVATGTEDGVCAPAHTPPQINIEIKTRETAAK
jgi:hypothetical protein